MVVSDRDLDRLELIVELIDAIHRRLDDMDRAQFVVDRDEIDLTAFRLGHIGEAAGKISPDIKSRHPSLPWGRMVSLRNVVSHEYGVIDPVIVWKTATEELAALRTACAEEIARLLP
jgi:uncharacterized protein with HEPN domain